MTWRVDVPFRCEPLNLNQTLHKMVKSARIKEIREAARVAAEGAGVPYLDRFSATLHYVPIDKRRRDPENWTPTSKAVVDGLVLAGVAEDDDPEHFLPHTPVIDPPQRDAAVRFYVVVSEWPLEPPHECPVPGCDHALENTK